MDLSIVVPARNEMFLSRTVEDILANMRGDTEVIVVLDGEVANPEPTGHQRLRILRYPISIGQRAATNAAVKLSNSRWIMKVDGHCAFDEGFDVKMMNDMQDNFTMVPVMRNLHAFDWVCKKCGDRRYQGTTPVDCPKCDNKTEFERDVVWIAKTNPQSISYCFDSQPHFQYFGEFKNRPEYQDAFNKDKLTETMSLQGSCFMLTRDKYWELNICDEAFGSWGSQGIEIACKTWLSGGRVIVNHKTWYAHMFRTKGGDFGFPYQIGGRSVQRAKFHARELFFGNKWEKQKYPLSWLIEKFWPIPGWSQEDLADLKKGDIEITKIELPAIPSPQPCNKKTEKGIIYYTDNRCDEKILKLCQEKLLEASGGARIISVSLKPIDFGENIVLSLSRGYLTMFQQILAGIEKVDCDILFLAEHDVVYSCEHFEFTPLNRELFYYNMNNWQVRVTDGHSAYWDCKKVSQVCAFRDLMLKHYTERVRRVELEGFSRRMGFEPGTHGRAERVDNYKSEGFRTVIPNLDLRHGANLTASRWSPTQFRNPCKNWQESHVNKLVGWENLKFE